MANKVYSGFFQLPQGHASNVMTDFCLVLEGGALRGLYTAGMLDAFMLNNLNASTVVGTSAGALNGLCYGCGSIGRFARLTLGFRSDGRYMGGRAIIQNGGVIGFKFAFKEYSKAEPIDIKRLNSGRQRLIACATNIKTGEAEYLENGKCDDYFKAVQASASMPYVSFPVKVGKDRYLDGGCACKIPYQWAIDQGFKKIVVVRTRDLAYRKTIKENAKNPQNFMYKLFPNFVNALETMNINYNKQVEELERLQNEGKLLMIAPGTPVSISRLEGDVEKLGDLYWRGYHDGNKAIEKIKEYLEKE